METIYRNSFYISREIEKQKKARNRISRKLDPPKNRRVNFMPVSRHDVALKTVWLNPVRF